MKYKILTPNEQYNGVTEGVPFAVGVGYTDNEAIKNVLVNDYGYKCEEKEAVKPKTQTEAKPKKTSGK
ncbi:hypothetical protein V7149_00195 [Bacillus sp. JJ1503]|uniref:hypothetical protein n=1 Tax=Bacillus sp. JJ1503 TaxID=3122956 RepID=UPI002FFEAC83